MSEFSVFLQNYLEGHGISSAELARRMDHDRTSLFRYVKGTRVPSDRALVLKMVETLRMNISERKELLRYYDFLVMGKSVVESYEGAVSLLRKLAENSQRVSSGKKFDKDVSGGFNRGTYELSGVDEIYNAVIYLGKHMINSRKERVLYVRMQPDYPVIQNFLQNQFEGSNIQVEQVICLEQSLNKNQNNFRLFQEVMSPGICSGNYSVRYYYDNIDAHINTMSWMPNMLVGKEVVIQFDKRLKHGILIRDEEYVRCVMKSYQEIRENTVEFFQKASMNDEDFFPMHAYSKTEEKRKINMIFMQPCFGPCISSDIYQTSLVDFPGKEALIKILTTGNGDWIGEKYVKGRISAKLVSYFSKRGMEQFAKEGIVYEFPVALHRPMDVRQRKLALSRLIELAECGGIEIHILDDDIVLPQAFSCYLEDEVANMEIKYIGESEMKVIKINEQGICRGFSEFLSYINEKKMALDEEETIECVKRMLETIPDE